MDIASIVGMLLGVVMFVFGVLSNGGVASLHSMWDTASFIITIGGSIAGTLASFKLADFINGIKSIKLIFKDEVQDPAVVINQIISLSNTARKEGLLALEEAANGIEDDFLKKGIMLVVDGTDPELVRGILETELVSIEGRHKDKIGFWETLGSMGPAWGMIGTLVGLVIMLQHMTDPSSLGPSMATALITTFYGSLLANWICGPVGNKLKSKNAAEIQAKEIMIEGLLSIQAGENPRVIEEKLKSFMSPKDRPTATEEGAGGEA